MSGPAWELWWSSRRVSLPGARRKTGPRAAHSVAFRGRGTCYAGMVGMLGRFSSVLRGLNRPGEGMGCGVASCTW
jgi:hypothetical protein